ncbi:ibr domain containing protein [Stylonychia lemnae]|uniref:RBR-type E3 ubiquitin transferase n=1 Tax=Stylonychia lemnae TaxID=5949 RepID=A0A078A6B0_STYLE|nr:ibr domain containing protein [Stylonychia lemnae]|eukprot:CDW77391.1 ibr domain containing protein [Stylonychia lemnae]
MPQQDQELQANNWEVIDNNQDSQVDLEKNGIDSDMKYLRVTEQEQENIGIHYIETKIKKAQKNIRNEGNADDETNQSRCIDNNELPMKSLDLQDKIQTQQINFYTEREIMPQGNFQDNKIHPIEMTLIDQVPQNCVEVQDENIQCEICYELIQTPDIIKLHCNHQYCQICLKEMILYASNQSGEVHKLKCPSSQCSAVLERSVIRNLLDMDEFKRYLRLIENHEMTFEKDKKFCPVAECEGVIERKANQKKTICQKCQNNVCFDCQSIWHENESCEKYQEKNCVNWADCKGAQRCPKCKTLIEKNEGCNHMTCYKCQHDFCWVCGLPFNHIIHSKKMVFFFYKCSMIEVKGKLCILKKTFCFLAFTFIFIPLMMLLLPFFICFVFGVAVPFYLFKTANSAFSCCLLVICFLPLFAISIALSVAIGSLGSALIFTFGFIPAEILNIYLYCRMVHWWQRGRLQK